MDPRKSVTALLAKVSSGDRGAKEELFRLVEGELRTIAEKYMRQERLGHTLQTTVLVDDAFVQLVEDGQELNWESRTHFFRTAAKAMRHILVDYQRKRLAEKRGGEQQQPREDVERLGEQPVSDDVLALDEALTKLAQLDARQSDIVELHHFGGYTLGQTADVLGVSRSTVKGQWRAAKAWLHRELIRGDREA